MNYNYIISKSLVFFSAYLVIYGYDSIGFVAALPLFGLMALYYIGVLLFWMLVTIWHKPLEIAAGKIETDTEIKNGKFWYLYHLTDTLIFAILAQIFSFNHFDDLSHWMIFNIPVSLLMILLNLRTRQIISSIKQKR